MVVTVTDDDSVVDFTFGMTNVNERVGSVVFDVRRTGNVGGQIDVAFGTSGGTALPTQDFVLTNGTLTFPPDVTNRSFSVVVINDKTVEAASEAFTVALAHQLGEFSVGSSGISTVNILDDDSELRFSQAIYDVEERSEVANVQIIRSGNTAQQVTVDYFFTEITAVAGADFTNAPSFLVFNAGDTVTNVAVGIINDRKIDQLNTNREAFLMTLSNPVGEVSLSAPSVATILIHDDDSRIQFATNSYSVLESSGVVLLDVVRDFNSDLAVSNQVVFISGGAVAGVEFQAVTNDLFFAPFELSKTIAVPILNDTLRESNKTFQVVLTNTTGEATIGLNAVATVTIRDDDSEFVLPQSTTRVSESASVLTYSVTRIGSTEVPVALDVVGIPSGATNPATLNVDYAAFDTNLTFGVGESFKNFSVRILGDEIVEGEEVFLVAVTNFVGEARGGAVPIMAVTILDDDFRIIQAGTNLVVSESFVPPNQAADPFEQVIVSIGLKNGGNVGASNMTAYLLPQGGVLNPLSTNLYPVIPKATNGVPGLSASLPFAFTVGQVREVRAVMVLSDGVSPVEYVTNIIAVGNSRTFTNLASNGSRLIQVPRTVDNPATGEADPYPSTIVVSKVTGEVVNRVKVHINGLTHTFPGDVDMLLAAPNGNAVLLMSDTGRDTPAISVNLTFDDDAKVAGGAPSVLPQIGQIVSGSYVPTDYAPADTFPAPAPVGPYSTNLSSLRGIDPNGAWKLYVYDDTDKNFGRILSGWSLELSTVNGSADVGVTQLVNPQVISPGSAVTFVATVSNSGPDTARSVVLSNQLDSTFSLLSVQASQGTVSTTGNQYTVNFGSIDIGGSATFVVSARINAAGTYANSVNVTAFNVDTNLANNASTLTFTVAAPDAFGLVGLLQTGTGFQISLTNTTLGRTYVVDRTDFLSGTSTVWTVVGSATAVSNTTILLDPTALGATNRVYRGREN